MEQDIQRMANRRYPGMQVFKPLSLRPVIRSRCIFGFLGLGRPVPTVLVCVGGGAGVLVTAGFGFFVVVLHLVRPF